MKLAVSILLPLLFAAGALSQVPTNGSAQSSDTNSTPQVTVATRDTAKDINKNATTSSGYVRPSKDVRQERYLKSLFGPVTIARQVASSGYATWRNSPEEWGDHWDGFGRRLASNFGKNMIKQTTIFGLDSTLHLDSHYYKSRKRDLGSKVTNAVLSPFTARNESGKRVFGVPRIAGTYASNIIAAEAWYPKSYGWQEGVRNGTISLGFGVAFNLAKELLKK